MNETVIERKDGVTLHVELKRGTGTRDQDKIAGTLHADGMDELREKRMALIDELQETAHHTREIQPEASTEDE